MPNRQEIEISISATGEVQLKVLGAPGSACLDLTKDLEAALGVVIAREKTSEYYSEGVIGSINQEQGGAK
jgi:hypothetical protein